MKNKILAFLKKVFHVHDYMIVKSVLHRGSSMCRVTHQCVKCKDAYEDDMHIEQVYPFPTEIQGPIIDYSAENRDTTKYAIKASLDEKGNIVQKEEENCPIRMPTEKQSLSEKMFLI